MGVAQVFRANVGVVVTDGRGRVLALERAGRRGAWQLPQGGLDEGEEPEEAALRELEEETGIAPSEVELLDAHPRWLAYELPPHARRGRGFRGQVQRWFLVRLLDSERPIDPSEAPDDEFDRHRWMDLEALAAKVWEVRRPIYEELARYFGPKLRAP